MKYAVACSLPGKEKKTTGLRNMKQYMLHELQLAYPRNAESIPTIDPRVFTGTCQADLSKYKAELQGVASLAADNGQVVRHAHIASSAHCTPQRRKRAMGREPLRRTINTCEIHKNVLRDPPAPQRRLDE
ncbi:unnamed protein product, partial [Ixodes pacificus]